MKTLLERIVDLLHSAAVHYEVIPHHANYTAQEAAQDTHTPGRQFAKTVVLRIDGAYVLAVLPAPRVVDLGALQRALGAAEVRLATEAEIAERFPSCEVGAVPPFGTFFDVPIYVNMGLRDDEQVTFMAGRHRASIRMGYGDLRRLAGAAPFTFVHKPQGLAAAVA